MQAVQNLGPRKTGPAGQHLHTENRLAMLLTTGQCNADDTG